MMSKAPAISQPAPPSVSGPSSESPETPLLEPHQQGDARRPTGSGSDDTIALDPKDLEEQTGGAVPANRGEDTPVYRPLRSGQVFGRYELLLEIASGGMATVYLARLWGPESFEKLLALKRIHDHLADEAEFVDMFLDEARLAARIQHPNVVTIFEMGEIEGRHYLTMEYVHGQSVADLLKGVVRSHQRLAWPVVARIGALAAAGLHAAHELRGQDGTFLGVVHRDVSPQNILLSYDGQVKIADFGVAYAAERLARTRTGSLKGKLAYMSPEQISHRSLDRRSDLFSLGIILYEMATMRRLFRRDTEVATLQALADLIFVHPRDLNRNLPPRFERIILKALSRDPEQRYPTAEAMAEDLEGLLVEEAAAVSRRDLGRLMEHVFHDTIRSKDQQIQGALQARTVPPLVGGDLAASDTDIVVPSPLPALESIPSVWPRWTLWVGMVVLLAAAVFAGTLIRWGDDGSAAGTAEKTSSRARPPAPGRALAAPRRPRRRAAPRARRTPPAEQPRSVSVRITVLPARARAEVVVDGRRYPGNRFDEALPISQLPKTVEVLAPGYRPTQISVTPGAPVRRTIRLRPLRRPGAASARRGRRRARRSMVRRRPRVRPMRPRAATDLLRDPMW